MTTSHFKLKKYQIHDDYFCREFDKLEYIQKVFVHEVITELDEQIQNGRNQPIQLIDLLTNQMTIADYKQLKSFLKDCWRFGHKII